MGYGNTGARIVKPTDKAKAFVADGGTVGASTTDTPHADHTQSFSKKGPEYKRMAELLAGGTVDPHTLSYKELLQVDPFFKQFKINSCRSNLCEMKKKWNERETVESSKSKFVVATHSADLKVVCYRDKV